MDSGGRGLQHLRFDAPTPRRLTPAERSRKAESDLLIYLKGGYTILGAIAKVVADYRLWRVTDRSPFEEDLLQTYNILVPPRSRHVYM